MIGSDRTGYARGFALSIVEDTIPRTSVLSVPHGWGNQPKFSISRTQYRGHQCSACLTDGVINPSFLYLGLNTADISAQLPHGWGNQPKFSISRTQYRGHQCSACLTDGVINPSFLYLGLNTADISAQRASRTDGVINPSFLYLGLNTADISAQRASRMG